MQKNFGHQIPIPKTLAEILPVAENYLHSCNICLFYVGVRDSIADGVHMLAACLDELR
jgi:hypothetical protein